jgi:hypothetical protein
MVALTRAHIADPDLVRKTIEGRVEDVRPCIGCNHGCIGGLLSVGRIGCTVNVAVGAEATLSEDLISKTDKPLRVLVVGGGPAGMEAARVAALSGHQVTLAEASPALGGSVNVAKKAPFRVGIGDITEWLEAQIYKLGVNVELSTYITSDDIRGSDYDAVIVATGSLPRMDGEQHLSPGLVPTGMSLPHVLSSYDLMMDRSRDWGKTALVFDDVGHYEAIAAAEFLLANDVAVTFATSLSSFAPKLETSLSSEPALQRLAKGDFQLITYAKLLTIDAGTVRIGRRFGGPEIDVPAETVVFVGHNASNRDLVDELCDEIRVIPAGDVRSPRFLQVAIREGHLAARNLVSQ